MYFDITEVRASTYGAINIYISSVFTLISFCTPYWLASDGRQPVKHFNNLGLWTVCFSSFYHPNYIYDKEFKGCRWLFDEDYSFLSNILEPPFFIFTQVFFTIGFVLLLVAVIGVLAIQLCFVIKKEIYAMKVLAIDLSISALFCGLAVMIFGIYGDDRDWMPDSEHNYLGWSFGLAVIGSFFQSVAAVLFWVENRILYKKKFKRPVNYRA